MNLPLAASLSERLPTYQVHTRVTSFEILKVTALRERYKCTSSCLCEDVVVSQRAGVSKRQTHGFAPGCINWRISSSFDVAKDLPHT